MLLKKLLKAGGFLSDLFLTSSQAEPSVLLDLVTHP